MAYIQFFFQRNWGIVSGSICSFIRQNYEDRTIPNGINHTLISMIPKCENPRKYKSLQVHKSLQYGLQSLIKNFSKEDKAIFGTNYLPL